MNKQFKISFNSLLPYLAIVASILLASKNILLIAHQFIYNSNGFAGVGFSDNIEYWSAFRLWQSGANPYDDYAMLKMQLSIRSSEIALMMWNPPWLLLLFYPLLSIGNYLTFSIVWFLSSIFAYLLACFLSLHYFAANYKNDFKLWALLLTFAPFLVNLGSAQIGCWLALGVSLVFTGILNKRTLHIVFGSILISLKPHLFIIFYITALTILFTQKKWSLLITILLAPIALATVTEIISNNGVLLSWINSLDGTKTFQNTLHPSKWITTTIPSILNNILFEQQNYTSFFVNIFFLLICLFISLWAVKILSWEKALTISLIVSLPLCPFAWLFDYTVIAPCMLLTWSSITRNKYLYNTIFLTGLLLLYISTSLIQQLSEALLPLLCFIGLFLVSILSDTKKITSTI